MPQMEIVGANNGWVMLEDPLTSVWFNIPIEYLPGGLGIGDFVEVKFLTDPKSLEEIRQEIDRRLKVVNEAPNAYQKIL